MLKVVFGMILVLFGLFVLAALAYAGLAAESISVRQFFVAILTAILGCACCGFGGELVVNGEKE